MPWVSRKKMDALINASNALIKELNQLQERTYLIDIQGHRFVFVRRGKPIIIDTLSLASDDFNAVLH